MAIAIVNLLPIVTPTILSLFLHHSMSFPPNMDAMRSFRFCGVPDVESCWFMIVEGPGSPRQGGCHQWRRKEINDGILLQETRGDEGRTQGQICWFGIIMGWVFCQFCWQPDEFLKETFCFQVKFLNDNKVLQLKLNIGFEEVNFKLQQTNKLENLENSQMDKEGDAEIKDGLGNHKLVHIVDVMTIW